MLFLITVFGTAFSVIPAGLWVVVSPTSLVNVLFNIVNPFVDVFPLSPT